MSHLQKIAEDIDVSAIVAQLAAAPELWNANPMRTTYPDSPHRDAHDVWVRARAETGGGLADYSAPHVSEWWPAAEKLPAIVEAAPIVMAAAGADELGGVLVTRIPAGKRIHAHTDKGHWHAGHYDRKAYLCIATNPQCVVWCANEWAIMKEGEAWRFENQVLHGLINYGETDRISVIYAMRAG